MRHLKDKGIMTKEHHYMKKELNFSEKSLGSTLPNGTNENGAEEPTGQIIQPWVEEVNNRHWLLPVAIGGLIVIMVAFGFYQFKLANQNCSELYVEAMKTAETPMVVTVHQLTTAEKALSLAFNAYNNEDYAAAIPHFMTYLQTNRTDYEKGLYLGICYTETNQFDEAQQLFKNIRTQSKRQRHQATWLLALSYLKQGDRKNCKRQLRWLMAHTPKHHKQHRAAEHLWNKL